MTLAVNPWSLDGDGDREPFRRQGSGQEVTGKEGGRKMLDRTRNRGTIVGMARWIGEGAGQAQGEGG